MGVSFTLLFYIAFTKSPHIIIVSHYGRAPMPVVVETYKIHVNAHGSPNGIRTRDSGVKGRRLRPLVDGTK